MMNQQTLDQINKKRKKVLTANAICIGMIAVGVLFFFTMPFLTIFIVIIAALGRNFLSGSNDYKLMFKTLIVEDVYKQHFDELTFNFEEGFSKEFVKEAQLISIGNTYNSDDYISGVYKGVHFKRSDVDMKNVTSNGKTTTTITYFKGPWMIFDCPKKFHSSTKVVEQEFLDSGNPGWFSGFEKLETESVAFNDIFNIFTTNEHDAFYLLTPHFMEKIIELEKRYEGRLTVGFINSKIHVLIYNDENALEPPVMEEITQKHAKVIEQQANIIVEICECLNLEREEM